MVLPRDLASLDIEEVMSGEELKLKFRDPLHDSRSPDIIVQPIYGTIYTGASKNKVAEHGGFSFGDTNVGLIVSNPALGQRVVKTPVLSSQVAPTILKSLGLDPRELQAVREEGIAVSRCSPPLETAVVVGDGIRWNVRRADRRFPG